MSAYTQRDETVLTKKIGKLLKFRDQEEVKKLLEERLFKIGEKGFICDTETKGYPTPNNRDPLEIVLDATDGFIPLWASDVTLRWRFQETALLQFVNVEEIKTYVRQLFAEGVLLWGDAAPVRFKEAQDAWDFEIVVKAENKCSEIGCTLASAFFPDGGRHEVKVYPRMFQQSRKEQVETMAHEVGHIFGLRHFFADVSETAWPVEVFGAHERFSIMNYGSNSTMTDNDRSDLKTLYALARSGALTHVNGTPIRLVRPFSATGAPTFGIDLIAARRA